MNITFNGWHGGASTGPRYMIPALHFFIILLSIIYHLKIFRKFSQHGLLPIVIALVVSFNNMMTIKLISPICNLYYEGDNIEWKDPLSFYHTLRVMNHFTDDPYDQMKQNRKTQRLKRRQTKPTFMHMIGHNPLRLNPKASGIPRTFNYGILS